MPLCAYVVWQIMMISLFKTLAFVRVSLWDFEIYWLCLDVVLSKSN